MPPVGGDVDELPDGGPFGAAPDGGVVDDPLGDSFVAGAELVDEGVDVVDEPLVAAVATAAPPPTRTPASPRPASVCRSRIFILFTSLHGIVESTCLLLVMRLILRCDPPEGL